MIPNSDRVPKKAVESVALGNEAVPITLEHDGEMEYVASSEIKSGWADFYLEHASDYVAVISDIALGKVPEPENNQVASAGQNTTDSSSHKELT